MAETAIRKIIHVDMDAFYASVEQHDRPELRGKPVIVGGDSRRSVVSAASYEARRFGVKSAMPMWEAKRLCPQGVIVGVRMDRYIEVSRQVMAIFARFTPLVEPLSVDEAFLDVTGTEALFGTPVEIARKIQRAVLDELGLSCSVGVAATKYVAKVASDLKKPAGLVVVPPGEERAFLDPLPVERLWGVGPKTAPQLHARGLRTIGDVARADRHALEGRLGALGAHIAALAAGEDARPVEGQRREKSRGAERTLERNITGPAAVRAVLLPLADEVAASLRADHLRARGVRLKVKFADFQRTSRELQLAAAAQDATSIMAALDELIPRVDTARPMRLVGLACTGLVDEDAPQQGGLFSAKQERAERIGRTLDAVKKRFGDDALSRGPPRPKRAEREARATEIVDRRDR